MPNLNRVLLMGNLTRDPELRYTQNNTAIVKIGLAVNRRWKNQAGETQEEVTYVDADAFGRVAELINQYFRKGRPIFIEGRLRLDQWQDKEGNNRSKLGVVIESFQFLDNIRQNNNDPSGMSQGGAPGNYGNGGNGGNGGGGQAGGGYASGGAGGMSGAGGIGGGGGRPAFNRPAPSRGYSNPNPPANGDDLGQLPPPMDETDIPF